MEILNFDDFIRKIYFKISGKSLERSGVGIQREGRGGISKKKCKRHKLRGRVRFGDAVSALDISAPDISAPDILAPDISAPDISAPDNSVPDISALDISVPDISALGLFGFRTFFFKFVVLLLRCFGL